jgi:hypothetical protein
MKEMQSEIAARSSRADLELTGASSSEGVLQPDAILPIQFFEGRRRSRAEHDPLRRLMFAVLIDALRSFQADLGAQQESRRREFAEAEFWLFRAACDEPFSFETVCSVLEIDAGRLRHGLSQWRARKLAGEAVPRMIRLSAVTPGKRVTARRRKGSSSGV